MTLTLEARDPAEAQAMVRDRLAAQAPIALVGSRTRCHFGEDTPDVISTRALRGVIFFHPRDMVIGVESGMPFADLKVMLDNEGMALPVNPWYVGATLGGMVAANDFGPERLERGGIRDFLIGMEYIDGRGERVKAGGRVVKNVTGYDLCRMMTGSLGGLGLITALNFKLNPAPIDPHTICLQSASPDWLDGLIQIHQSRLPIDWLEIVGRDGAWLLGLGISGNSARRSRLEGDIGKILGQGTAVFADGEETPPFECFSNRNRFGGFLSRHRTGLAPSTLHLQGIFPTAAFLDRNFLDRLNAHHDLLILHPFGGDAHLFGRPEMLGQLPETLRALSRPDGYWMLAGAGAASKVGHGACYPPPTEFAFMQRLKQHLDPRGIFYSPFYERHTHDRFAG